MFHIVDENMNFVQSIYLILLIGVINLSNVDK